MKTEKRKAPKDGQHIVEWFNNELALLKAKFDNPNTVFNANFGKQFDKLIKEAKEYEELRGLKFFRKGMEFQYHETNMNECK